MGEGDRGMGDKGNRGKTPKLHVVLGCRCYWLQIIPGVVDTGD